MRTDGLVDVDIRKHLLDDISLPGQLEAIDPHPMAMHSASRGTTKYAREQDPRRDGDER
jgi:hypothetical protein